VVLATDGLFEDLTNQQVVEYVGQYLDKKTKNLPPTASAWLVERALVHAAMADPSVRGKPYNEILYSLMGLPAGRSRRRRHDDVTVIVVHLAATSQSGEEASVESKLELQPEYRSYCQNQGIDLAEGVFHV